MTWGMMLARLAFIMRAYKARVGPLETISIIPIRSFFMKTPWFRARPSNCSVAILCPTHHRNGRHSETNLGYRTLRSEPLQENRRGLSGYAFRMGLAVNLTDEQEDLLPKWTPSAAVLLPRYVARSPRRSESASALPRVVALSRWWAV